MTMSIAKSMSTKKRAYGIDAFRLLTTLFVVTAHGGRFEHFPETVHDAVAIAGKWAVPFFFVVLGFFTGRSTDKNRTIPQMIRIGVMFLLASLMMIPLDIAQEGVHGAITTVSTYFMICGGHFHLWFLSSLIMGLLVIRITDEMEISWLLPVLAVGALLVAVWLGTYWTGDSVNLGRHLISIPYLWFGTLLAKNRLSTRTSLYMIAGGIVLLIGETAVLYQLGRGPWEAPSFLGAVPFALGMFGVASNLPNTPFIERVGKLGMRFTGCIYVTHVYFIYLVDHLATAAGIRENLVYCALVIPIVLSLNLATLLCIDRYAPICIDVLLGDKAAIQRAGRAISEPAKNWAESTGIFAARRVRP
jgi:hypothetical protein